MVKDSQGLRPSFSLESIMQAVVWKRTLPHTGEAEIASLRGGLFFLCSNTGNELGVASNPLEEVLNKGVRFAERGLQSGACRRAAGRLFDTLTLRINVHSRSSFFFGSTFAGIPY